ncbi:MAG: response regulator transcription factor [Bacteroidetes bacterium]|nr:response regulator transcription factor [Bacteroidota bacterium]MBS1735084.1 response regulator transcription factor [Bacteroidota bacterium]
MEIRITIFEDNKLVRDALQAILNGTPGMLCTGVFSDCNHWDADIKRSRPDVILMDIEMPGMSGIEATKAISSAYPDIKILIQTVFNDSERIFRALCAGASGYILKTDPPHKCIEAIHEVYNGGAPISSTVAKKILNFFSASNVILVTPEDTSFGLSDREKEILELMIEGHKYKPIADKLFISYETVRTHVKHIYKKLHVASRSEAIQKAKQHGLR